MNKLALAAALALMIGSAAQAKVIELVPEAPGDALPSQARIANPGPAAPPRMAAPPASMSELPEPEVFAMMLVGLVLLGYRARRDSSEKFE
ncbi:PEP-CTERM sorting domain-containing protein [Massilia niabensis]|uniref:PEP-CTERM sorting domain-containing protein n=1 Tax=Massilia niabensis TaxID=544910 RepID=A0ABW0L936_9BURK